MKKSLPPPLFPPLVDPTDGGDFELFERVGALLLCAEIGEKLGPEVRELARQVRLHADHLARCLERKDTKGAAVAAMRASEACCDMRAIEHTGAVFEKRNRTAASLKSRTIITDEQIRAAMNSHSTKTDAAAALGMSRPTLNARLKAMKDVNR